MLSVVTLARADDNSNTVSEDEMTCGLPMESGAGPTTRKVVRCFAMVLRLLTTLEVAERLGISERHARRLLVDMPVVRLGRCVRVDERDLDEWVAAKKVGPSFAALASDASPSANPPVSKRWRFRRNRAR